MPALLSPSSFCWSEECVEVGALEDLVDDPELDEDELESLLEEGVSLDEGDWLLEGAWEEDGAAEDEEGCTWLELG